MSNKRNIDSICGIVSSEANILIRDSIEIERLQSAEANVLEKFAVASYRKFTQKIIFKITNLISAYEIRLPAVVQCFYNGRQQSLPIGSIIETKEFEGIGDRNIGFFMISPIDGMVNFVRSVPSFCSSVAIFVNSDDKVLPHQSLVYDVPNNKFYTATLGHGAFLNSVKLMVSSRSKIYTSVISVSGLESLIKENQTSPDVLKLASKVKNITISAAGHISGIPSQLAACYLAAGKLDIVIECNLKDPSGIVSGAIIAKESGCYILNKDGNEITIDDIVSGQEKVVILTNRSVVDEVIKVLKL